MLTNRKSSRELLIKVATGCTAVFPLFAASYFKTRFLKKMGIWEKNIPKRLGTAHFSRPLGISPVTLSGSTAEKLKGFQANFFIKSRVESRSRKTHFVNANLLEPC